MIRKTDKQLRSWHLHGTYFGFPECCKEFFLKNSLIFVGKGRWWLKFYPFTETPFKGTGYIPCINCATTKTKQEMIDAINSRRLCSVPFPDMKNSYEFHKSEMEELIESGKLKVPDTWPDF